MDVLDTNIQVIDLEKQCMVSGENPEMNTTRLHIARF